MAHDIEERLAAGAEALREHELTTRRAADLRARIAETAVQLKGWRARLDAEQADVDRLEGITLSRLVASLRGARDDALARERAEADAVRYRVTEAEQRLAALREELLTTTNRLRRLSDAPRAYASLLYEKERALADSDDPRRSRLLELADARGRLVGEHRELTEALHAANAAWGALTRLQELLSRASDWSTYDALGGGLIVSAVKHDILDEAAQMAAHADRNLALLRTELADVADQPHAPQLDLGDLTRFTDIWLDNIVTDLVVMRRVGRALGDVDRSMGMLSAVRRGLTRRTTEVGTRLSDVEAERLALLNRR